MFINKFSTTRRLTRIYKRLFKPVPSSLLVWPKLYETAECARFIIPVPGLNDEDVKISVENNTVLIVAEGDEVFEATHGFKKYISYVDLPDINSPDKIYTTRGIKADMKFGLGEIELTIPKLKQDERTFNLKVNRIFTS